MPRLGSFLVCEKIIQDQLGKPTLISVFQKMSAVVPEGQEMPKEVIAATPWAIFCEWFFTEEELKRKWEQVLEVLMPDGSPTPIRGRVELKEIPTNGQGARAYVFLMGVPISQVGFIAVNVWLECNSERITDVFSYKILIEHAKNPPIPDIGGTIFPAMVPKPPVIPQ